MKIAWALAAAVGAAAPASAADAPKTAMRMPRAPAHLYRLAEGRFTFEPPKGWRIVRQEAEDAAAKAYGVALLGPATQGVPALIFVTFHSDEEGASFKDADDYIAAQTAPGSLPVETMKAGAVELLEWRTLRARRFTRESHEFVPPKSRDAKKVAVREEFLVAEPGRGFYVIRLSAARAGFKAARRAYAKVLDTFAPVPAP